MKLLPLYLCCGGRESRRLNINIHPFPFQEEKKRKDIYFFEQKKVGGGGSMNFLSTSTINPIPTSIRAENISDAHPSLSSQ